MTEETPNSKPHHWDWTPIMPEAEMAGLPIEDALEYVKSALSAMDTRAKTAVDSMEDALVALRQKGDDQPLINNAWQLITAASFASRVYSYANAKISEYTDYGETRMAISQLEEGYINDFIDTLHLRLKDEFFAKLTPEETTLVMEHPKLERFSHLLEFALGAKYAEHPGAGHYAALPGLKRFDLKENFEGGYVRVCGDETLSPEERGELAAEVLSQRIYTDWQQANNTMTDPTPEKLRQGKPSSALFAKWYGLPEDIIEQLAENAPDIAKDMPPRFKEALPEKWSFEEARELIVSAYRDFHPLMGETANELLDGNLPESQTKDRTTYVHVGPDRETMGKTFAISGISKKDYPEGRDFISIEFDGSLESIITLAHETGHAIATQLEGKTTTTWGRLGPAPLHETFAQFGEKLLSQKILAQADNPTQREQLANVLATRENDNVTTSLSGVLLEHEVFNQIAAHGRPVTMEQVDAIQEKNYRLCHNVGPETPIDSDYLRNRWSKQAPHLYNYGAYYLGSYVVAEAGSRALADHFFSASPEDQRSIADGWMKVMANGHHYAQDFAGAMAEAGLDCTKPDFIESAFKANVRAVAEKREQAPQNTWVSRMNERADTPTPPQAAR